MTIFPATTLDGVPPSANELEGVSFLPRAGARLIDYVAHAIVAFVGGAVAAIFIGVYAAISGRNFDELLGGREIMVTIFGIIGFIFFTALPEALSGATIGKRLLGLVVVSEDRTRIWPGQAFKRSLAFVWDSFFFGLVAYSGMKRSALRQRYGDSWAETMVVKRNDVDPRLPHSDGRLLLGVFLGALADGVCLTTGMLLDVVINH